MSVTPALPPGAVAVELGMEVLQSGQARLWMLPQRVAFDPDRGLLLVADAHLGKAVSFRRLGVPVPGGTTAQTLARLDEAIDATGADQIVFLGDLLHSRRSLAAETMAEIAAWRDRRRGLGMTLVRGNHDAHAGDPPSGWDISAHDAPMRVGPWALLHEPAELPDAYSLAGHLHPGVVLAGRANDRLRLPCFRFAGQCGLLPAFGEFTGLHVPVRRPDEQVFAVAGDRVIPV